ncbi:MAG: hypothetical protein LBL15_07195 [Oscillospiraceae bacterium]|jgi:hypothetical protein|nr:hypothetical protein [Oscillospiraceae bacterium]
MKNNDISTVTPNEALPTENISTCTKCGAKWETGNEVCPWCGADKSGIQILPFNFRFPQIDTKQSKWNKERPVPVGKVIPILLVSIVFGAILYFLLPIILAFSMALNIVILVLVVYALASAGIAFGISAIFKRLINVWGKGNSSWLVIITAIIIFIPSALRNTVTFWSAGGVQGIASLLMGCVLPILGFAGIAIFYSMAGSGKFCPYCDFNVYLRKDVIKVHSCHTAELIRRISENAPKGALSDLGVPEASKHAFTAVDLYLCKKPDCRHAQINVYQHMMHLTYSKQNNQWQENDVNRLIAEYEISGETFDLWTAEWDKKDSLA